MAAMYRVTFRDGESFVVHSADSKSSKPADREVAYRKARDKAKEKRRRARLPRSAVVSIRCVG